MTPGATLRVGAPQVVFEGDFLADLTGPNRLPNYDVSPDGERFLMLTQNTSADTITVVLNWHSELLERVPLP